MIKLMRNRPLIIYNFMILSKGKLDHTIANYDVKRIQSRKKLPEVKLTLSRLLATESLNTRCWKCDNAVGKELFCDKCLVIQKPPSDVNFYKLFALDEDYCVEESFLAKKFRELQKVLHPDKFSLRPQDEKSIAEEYSSLINKAYTTLKNPWSRGVYLLKISGIDFDEETTVDDPNLLLLVMERNEQVAEISEIDALQRIDETNKEDIELITKSVALHFKNGQLDEAKKQLIKLKYFTNIDSKISDKKFTYGIRLSGRPNSLTVISGELKSFNSQIKGMKRNINSK